MNFTQCYIPLIFIFNVHIYISFSKVIKKKVLKSNKYVARFSYSKSQLSSEIVYSIHLSIVLYVGDTRDHRAFMSAAIFLKVIHLYFRDWKSVLEIGRSSVTCGLQTSLHVISDKECTCISDINQFNFSIFIIYVYNTEMDD